tara:strand:+ start:1079 stop:2158 length:1080 start_codon:yes stop_codon:yes gene_type:complete
MSNQLLMNVFQKLILEKQSEIQELKKDKVKNKKLISGLTFKVINFRKAIKAINEHPTVITKGEDLKEVKGIGKGIMERINEILKDGTLKDEIPEGSNQNEKRTNLELLSKITGIGPAKAKSLLDLKITLEMLMDEMVSIEGDFSKIIQTMNLSQLTHHQLIGVKYFEDITKPIPRKELLSIRLKLIKFISQLEGNYEVIICGSFRRKKPTSGDIDVLILSTELPTEESIRDESINHLQFIVEHLKKKKLIVDSLTVGGSTKFMGLCKATKAGIGRRIDIRLIPYQSKASAMLYFTGSGNFNKVMRTHALKKGYTINEYGIYKLKKEGKKMVKGALIPTESEEDIFKIVGMKYVTPKDRL